MGRKAFLEFVGIRVPPKYSLSTEEASQAVNGLIQGTRIDQVWKLVEARFAAHVMDNYRKRIG
ncbi:MAG: hypothetical protein KatS3mg108_2447 [Isosphaeraceae bacterium]|jgi:hypothetical protein|nr:MAG: hypothetical protein KatS3mg108_2447 [Isosphaeraceae bacterium]